LLLLPTLASLNQIALHNASGVVHEEYRQILKAQGVVYAVKQSR